MKPSPVLWQDLEALALGSLTEPLIEADELMTGGTQEVLPGHVPARRHQRQTRHDLLLSETRPDGKFRFLIRKTH